jgi:hypothetical protein
MPTFDSGTYFLTTLIPIRTDTVLDGEIPTSAIHALRKEIEKLPTKEWTLSEVALSSDYKPGPFARNRRNHFARLVVIDDVAYVGRDQPNTLIVSLNDFFPRRSDWEKDRFDPVIAQPQDHLSSPFLFFSSDFDATTGDDKDRDSYLIELWDTASTELKAIFQYCYGFNERVRDGASFAAYVASCQLETTMPFHDYWLDGVPVDKLPNLSPEKAGGVFAGAALAVFLALYHFILPGFLGWVSLLLAFAGAILAGGAALYFYVLHLGKKPFPAAPDATLPDVLKALHLRREFTRFVIENQLAAAADKASVDSAQKLYAAFAKFIVEQRPDDIDHQTQPPGLIGI